MPIFNNLSFSKYSGAVPVYAPRAFLVTRDDVFIATAPWVGYNFYYLWECAMGKSTAIFFALLLAVLMLVACGGQNGYVPVSESAQHGNDSDVHLLPFAEILNAYAELELSAFAIVDNELIGHSILAQGMNPFSFPEETRLVYALHDINGDGAPELFIGYGRRDFNTITGIYTIQNSEPISIIQLDLRSSFFVLRIDVNDGYVIEYIWGRMGHAINAFYALNENGELITLDVLITSGLDWSGGEWVEDEWIGDGPYHLRFRVVDGEEVSITEEEYSALIRKYGAHGYGTLYHDPESVRIVSLEWMPVLSVYR